MQNKYTFEVNMAQYQYFFKTDGRDMFVYYATLYISFMLKMFHNINS